VFSVFVVASLAVVLVDGSMNDLMKLCEGNMLCIEARCIDVKDAGDWSVVAQCYGRSAQACGCTHVRPTVPGLETPFVYHCPKLERTLLLDDDAVDQLCLQASFCEDRSTLR
jgi:hypothetical protein